jgi:hypothetical protein
MPGAGKAGRVPLADVDALSSVKAPLPGQMIG